MTLENIYSSWDELIEQNIIPNETKGFIVDYREAHFQFDVTKYHFISDYYKKNIEIFGKRKIAILSETPKDVALLILVQLKDNGYKTNPFTTLPSALNWIRYGS